MRKILLSIIIFTVTISIYLSTYATASIPFNFTGETEVIKGENEKITLIISLGAFTEIPAEPIMGYEAVLNYDTSVFSSVEVEGLNDWTAQYVDGTKRLIGETGTTAVENKEIAKITLTLNSNAVIGDTTVELTDVLLTVNDDDSLDFKYKKEITITIKEKQEQQTNEENGTNDRDSAKVSDNAEEGSLQIQEDVVKSKETSNNTNNATDNKNKNNIITIKATQEDTTTANNSIPKTGIGKIMAVLFGAILSAIICLKRYKSIKIK